MDLSIAAETVSEVFENETDLAEVENGSVIAESETVVSGSEVVFVIDLTVSGSHIVAVTDSHIVAAADSHIAATGSHVVVD